MVLTPFRKSRGSATRSRLKVSFEFFPPKTEEMERPCGNRSSALRRSAPPSSP